MNFLAGKADGGGRVALDHGGGHGAARGACAGRPAVTVGIRPEHLHAVRAERDALCRGPVEMVEQLGADTLVHIGARRRQRHRARCRTARTPRGRDRRFAFDADPARVFAVRQPPRARGCAD